MLVWQLQAANQFRLMWVNQVDFFRQLTWRAPTLERDTAILLDSEVLPLMRGVGFTLNAVYEQAPTDKGQLAYWYFPMDNKVFTDPSSEAIILRDGRYSTYFDGNSRDFVALSFRTDGSQCLWLVNADQANYAPRTALFTPISRRNAFNRVSTDDGNKSGILEDLFGREEPLSWCYTFEKADLARQFGDWEKVKSLWEQSESRGARPLHGLEYLPFIEAYARLGNLEKAVVLNRQANRASPEMETALCPFWQRIDQDVLHSGGTDYFLQEAVKLLKCEKVKK
jgi:hypothetical protein